MRMMNPIRDPGDESKLETTKKSRSSPGIGMKPQMVSSIVCVTMWLTMCVINIAEALPFPAPNLQNCRSPEGCCTPALSARSKNFQFQTDLPKRIRPAAHLVDDAYIAKYQRATELMRALPATDGRAFVNQYKLHCVYCDKNLYYSELENDGGLAYALAIHGSWLFYPWHRLYLYFHERILAKLIDDDTFALPFWNWDNQSPEHPQANVVPYVYREPWRLLGEPDRQTINRTSSLYDPDRGLCSNSGVGFGSFQSFKWCPTSDKDAEEVRKLNANVMYMHMVSVGVTPKLFHGYEYRYGDEEGAGPGAIEFLPHAVLHLWMNRVDMNGFKDAASDPIFFAHHANLDRIWELWKTLPGGTREDIADRDYLDTEFTFYDEDGGIVTASVAQALQLDQLRYTYEKVPNPWLYNPMENAKICNPHHSPSELAALVNSTPIFENPFDFITSPVTFKVKRPRRHHVANSHDTGEEVLEIRTDLSRSNLSLGEIVVMAAFAFHPAAKMDESLGCAEYLSTRWLFKHVGSSPRLPLEDVWRMGIRHQGELMATAHLEDFVVTITPSAVNKHGVVLKSARIVYSNE